jgi:hypothetical protein
MVAHPRIADLRRRLTNVRAETHRLRLMAFVDYSPVVCGVALRPMTLRSYTLLCAWDNAFVVGGPVEIKSIVQFIWAHHPDFAQHAHTARRRVALAIDRALRPRLPTLNALICFFAPFVPCLRRFCRPTAAELIAAAIAEIRRLVNESLHDFPIGGNASEDSSSPDEAPPSDPLPFALPAYFVGLLVRAYGLPFVEARQLVMDLPLKELLEYTREAIHRLSNGKEPLLTRDEAAVWWDYLGAINSPADFPLNSQPSTLN